MKREYAIVYVELPTRAEILRHGTRVYDGWPFGHDAIYAWRGRQYKVSPRRGKPRIVWLEAECPEVSQ